MSITVMAVDASLIYTCCRASHTYDHVSVIDLLTLLFVRPLDVLEKYNIYIFIFQYFFRK